MSKHELRDILSSVLFDDGFLLVYGRHGEVVGMQIDT